MNNVYHSRRLNDREKIVLYVIEHSLPSERVCIQHIVSESGMNIKHVREAVNGLLEKSLIVDAKLSRQKLPNYRAVDRNH